MDGGWVVGSVKYCPLCHHPQRKELDRLIVDRKRSFWDVAKKARVARHTVTTHSKHLTEVLHQERKQTPLVINYAPTINVVIGERSWEEPAESIAPPTPRGGA